MTTEAIIALLGGGSVFTIVGVILTRLAIQYTWLRNFMTRVHEVRRAVVLEVDQTYVDRIAEFRKPGSDGGEELTPTEAMKALRSAVQRCKEMLGIDALKRALALMGLPHEEPEFIDRWITTWVEATVKEVKIQTAAAEGAPVVRAAVMAAAAVRAASGEFPPAPMPLPPPGRP